MFNVSMFKLLRHGKEQEIKTVSTYKSYDDSHINSKEQVGGQEIIISNTATFTFHIRNKLKMMETRWDGG